MTPDLFGSQISAKIRIFKGTRRVAVSTPDQSLPGSNFFPHHGGEHILTRHRGAFRTSLSLFSFFITWWRRLVLQSNLKPVSVLTGKHGGCTGLVSPIRIRFVSVRAVVSRQRTDRSLSARVCQSVQKNRSGLQQPASPSALPHG